MIKHKLIWLILCCTLAVMNTVSAEKGEGMILTTPSPYDFSTTRQRLLDSIHGSQLKLFAELDHTTAAQENGLKMPPTTVLVFGNPKVGTPLMLSHPSLALDLPYRVLISAKADGKVVVSYPDETYFSSHGLTLEENAVMAKLPAFVRKALKN